MKSILSSSAIWQTLGNIAYSIALWICLIILARTSNTEQVGYFAFAMAVTAPVFMFSNLRLRLVFATDARYEFSPVQYVVLRALMTMLALAILAIASTIFIADPTMKIVILILAMAKAVEAMSDILYGYFQLQECGKKVGISMLLKALLVVITVSVTLPYWSSASNVSLVLLGAWVSLLILYDFPYALKSGYRVADVGGSRLKNHCQQLKLLLRKTLPLAFVALICSVTTNMPRYFLEVIVGASGLGMYAAVAYFGVGLTLIAAGIGQASLPELGRTWNASSIEEFRSLYLRLIRFAGVIGTGSVIFTLLFGKDILGIVYGAEYQEQSHVFVIIVVAASLNIMGLYQWYIMTAMRMFRHQLILSMVVLLTLVGLCFMLVSNVGLVGAALAEVLAALLQVGIGGWLIARKLAEKRSVERLPVVGREEN